MNELRPRASAPVGRVAVLVARYNEVVTLRLMDGARKCLSERGVPKEQFDVAWVPGTFELPAAAAAAAASGRYVAIVALGAVIRGETPHYAYVADSAAHALAHVSVLHGVPVGFGVLTVDDLKQAIDRAGGALGNKGFDATAAALDLADVIAQLKGAPD